MRLPRTIFHFLFFFIVLALNLQAQNQPGSGRSLQFNGANNFINAGAHTRNITNQVTVEAWIKTTNLNLQMICTKYDNNADLGFQLLTQNGKASINGRDGNNLYKTSGFSTTSINDGKWHHVTGVINLNKWEIWVDGNLENSANYTHSNNILTTSTPLSIGNYFLYSSHYFQGEIDEVRIWNTARTAQQIRDNMCRKLVLPATGLVGYYKFDEGSGNTVTDLSPLNITGSLTNFSGSFWRTSGAAIGDISTYTYFTNATGVKLKLPGIANDTVLTQDITNATGIHIYRVNSAPNTPPPFSPGLATYFGVFAAGATANYTLGYKPAAITCTTDSARIIKRQDNSVFAWQTFAMPVNATYTYFEKSGEIHRGEYTFEILDAVAKVQITGNQSLCTGAPVTLTATAGSSYLWSTGHTTQSISVTNPGNYSVTATNPLGCSSTNSVNFTPKPLPIANAGPDVAVCYGASASIGTVAIPGYTYSWSPAVGLSSSTSSNPLVTIPNNTNLPISQTFTVTTTFNGCTATDQVIFTVNPRALINNFGTPDICANTPTVINTPQPPGQTYLWAPATGLSDPTSPNPTVTLPNATNSPITVPYSLTVTNAYGCSVTGASYVTVFPETVANAGSDVSICSGASASLGIAATAGYTYSWSPAIGLSNTSVSNPTVTLPNTTNLPINQTYTLTSTFYGCTKTDQVTVTVFPSVLATPGLNKQICSGEPTIIGAPAIPGNTYLWSPATGLSDPTVANPTVTLVNPSNFSAFTQTYTLAVTNAFGCVATGSVLINVAPSTITSAGPDKTICSGGFTWIGGAGNNVQSYLWTPATGLSSATSHNPSVTLTNNTSAPVTYVYTLTASSAGCSTTDQVIVTVNPLPVLFNSPNLSTCSNAPLQIGPNPVAGNSYLWSPTTGLSDPAIAQPTATLVNNTTTPTLQQYSLTITNPEGCSVTSSFLVEILPLPITEAGPDVTICSKASTTLGVPAKTGYTYSWSPAIGLSSTTSANPTFSLTNNTGLPITQTYTLTATYFGCTTIDQVTVTVNPLPVPLPGTDKTICSGQSTSIGGAPVAGNSYSWFPVSGLSSATNSNPTVTLANNTNLPVVHTYKLTVTNSLNCIDTTSVRVTVNPLPISIAGNDVILCSGDSTRLGTGSTSGYTYSWSPAIGLSSTTAANPSFSLLNNTSSPVTQLYTVTSTYYGCVTSDQVLVTVNPAIILDAGPDKVICADESVVIGTPALPGYTYSWAAANGLSTLTSAQTVFTGLNNTASVLPVKLYLTVTSTATNCAKTDSVIVTINPRPLMDSISGSPSVCPGVVGVNYRMVAPRLSNYQWLIQGGTITSGQGTPAITVDWGPTGNGKIQAYTINSFGCSSDTVSFNVIINQLLITQKPAGPTQLCFYEAKNIHYQTPVTTTGSFYTYQVFGGTITSPNPSSAGISVNWHAPGIGKLLVTETSTTNLAFCFGVSDTLTVTINPSPDTTLAINGVSSACALSVQNTYTLNGPPNSTYAWTFNGNLLPDTDNEVKIDLPPAGTYTLSVVETNSFGCPGRTISKQITATPLPGTLTINGPTIICPDNQTNLVYSVSGLPGSTYQWQVNGGVITSGNGSNTIYVDFDNTRDKQIQVVETSSGNCIGSAFNLTANLDISEPLLTVISTSEANDRNVEMKFNLTGNGVNTKNLDLYRREAGVANSLQKIASLPTSTTTFTDQGLVTTEKIYEYLVESQNECGTVVRRTLMHNTMKLTAVAEEKTKTVTLSWNTYRGWRTNGVSAYEVYGKADNGEFKKILTAKGSDSLVNLPNIAGQGFSQCFRVKAISPNGLSSWTNISCVSFVNDIVVYNVITPNNDDKNDFFFIENIHLYPGNELKLFNRWGKEIYQTKDYRNNWSGKDFSGGTYYYHLKLKDNRTYKGWFEIIR